MMWAQIVNTALGIWLMAAPGIFGYNGVAADNDQIIGPVVTSFAIIALSGCTRSVANYNIPFGAWLIIAPWVLGYEKESAMINDICAGVLVTAFSFFKRKSVHSYGGGWTAIWKEGTGHELEAQKMYSKNID